MDEEQYEQQNTLTFTHMVLSMIRRRRRRRRRHIRLRWGVGRNVFGLAMLEMRISLITATNNSPSAHRF